MMRYIPFALYAFAQAIALRAQPVLTQATNGPVPGNVFNLNYSAYADPGPAGAGATWDFSTITVDSTDVVQWVLPSATPNGPLFPGATVAELWDVISYSEVSSSGISVIGSDEQGTIVLYSDPRLALPFPCTYQTTWNDPYAGAYSMGGLDVVRQGSYGGTADGYGTLIMPWGTVPDVLRTHVQAAQEDSTLFGTLYLYIDAFQYFVADSAWPVLQVVTSTAVSIGGTFTVEYTLWMDDLGTGADQRNTTDRNTLRLWPDPATGPITIATPSALRGGELLRIHDAQGRLVLERNAVMGGDDSMIRMDVSSLQPGAYVLSLVDPTGRLARTSFVVER